MAAEPWQTAFRSLMHKPSVGPGCRTLLRLACDVSLCTCPERLSHVWFALTRCQAHTTKFSQHLLNTREVFQTATAAAKLTICTRLFVYLVCDEWLALGGVGTACTGVKYSPQN